MEFKNKVAVITGGGGHIGKHIAMRLAMGGATVAVVDFMAGTAETAANEINEAGGIAKAFVCDVKDWDLASRCFGEIVREFGKVDILVTSAGGSTRSLSTTFDKQSPEVIIDNIGVNLYGALWFAKLAAEDFIKRGESGRMIFISSILGIQGRERHVEYSTAKGGVIAMAKSLAKELGHIGVTVNCVSPGLVNRPDDKSDVRPTNFLGQYCSADDIADAAEFLASDSGKFITGHNLIVDGGRSLGLKGVK